MKRTRTSKGWMSEHTSDLFVKQAQRDGYRSRAAYKLLEINEKYDLFKPGLVIIDLGSAPGSWSQVVIKEIGTRGKLIALDLLEMKPIKNVEFVQGDFRENTVLDAIKNKLKDFKFDLVISDMAPNISGVKVVDQQRAINLNELALDFALKHLKQNGFFLVKSFVGSNFEEYVKNLRASFKKVFKIKPDSSRSRSSEIFLLGYEFCGG